MTDNEKIASAIICYILIVIYAYFVFKSCWDGDEDKKPLSGAFVVFVVGLPISIPYCIVYVIISDLYFSAIHASPKTIPSTTISGRAVLIIGIISIITMLIFSYDCSPKEIIDAMTMRKTLLPRLFKNNFIHVNDYLETSIDGIMIKKPVAIKKLAIINKDLIPKLNKVEKLISKNEKIRYNSTEEYEERWHKLIIDKHKIIDKIKVLCDEIIKIENSTEINSIDEEINKFEKTL